LTAETLALGTDAPLESRTWPTIAPASFWANAGKPAAAKNTRHENDEQ
jgi:hypothetical protein